VVAWQLAKVVKEFIRRGRPKDELERIAFRMGTPKDGRGFPSGHTAVAATMVTVLWPAAGPAERMGLLAAALVVAFARIQVGAHLPVDTIGGAALGVLTGELWRLAVGDGEDAVVEGTT
jgi:undecaprenyl-diphosphatase